MSITQNISEITPLSAFTSPNRPAEVDNLVENELPNLTQELGLLIPQINETTYQASLAAQNTEASKNIATTQAGIATTKASEASASANQALTYKNQVMGYVVPSGASYSVDQLNTKYSAMTKAQFNALAEERKANRAGSGFDEYGKHHISITTLPNVNDGMFTVTSSSNVFCIGKDSANSTGTSKTQYPVVNINGVKQIIDKINSTNAQNNILLPTAPNIYPYDTVLTTEQINSGVIKHADSSNSGLVQNGKGLSGTTFNQTVITVSGKKYTIEYKDNGVSKTLEITATSTTYNISLTGTNITEVGMYPNDAISRSDLVFSESYHEDTSEKNMVYPLGNPQYLGGNTDGLTGIANGSFSGFETYSLFGNWQTPSSLIGKGYVWSSLTEVQKKAFIANPDNNCYLDGDKTIQVRYRIRVVQGWGDSWESVDNIAGEISGTRVGSLSFAGQNNIKAKGKKVSIDTDLGTVAFSDLFLTYGNTSSKQDIGTWSTGSTFNGAYESKCYALPIALIHRRNQGGYNATYNPNGTKTMTMTPTSISDCFNPANYNPLTGYIGTSTSRPDGLLYDQVSVEDFKPANKGGDLRNSSKKRTAQNIIEEFAPKVIANTIPYYNNNTTALTTYKDYFDVRDTSGNRYFPKNKIGNVVTIQQSVANKKGFSVVSQNGKQYLQVADDTTNDDSVQLNSSAIKYDIGVFDAI